VRYVRVTYSYFFILVSKFIGNIYYIIFKMSSGSQK